MFTKFRRYLRKRSKLQMLCQTVFGFLYSHYILCKPSGLLIKHFLRQHRLCILQIRCLLLGKLDRNKPHPGKNIVIMYIFMALTCNLTPALRSPKRAMMTCNIAWRGNKPLCTRRMLKLKSAVWVFCSALLAKYCSINKSSLWLSAIFCTPLCVLQIGFRP